MPSVTLQIPEELAKSLEARAGGARRVEDVALGDLLERAAAIEKFEALMREGEESGPPIPWDDDYISNLREKLRVRVAAALADQQVK